MEQAASIVWEIRMLFRMRYSRPALRRDLRLACYNAMLVMLNASSYIISLYRTVHLIYNEH